MTTELQTAVTAAQKAGAILMRYFKSDLSIKTKADKFDPVTQADTEADDFLRKTIGAAFPSDAILSEENTLQPDSYKGRVWMIDPLDGTKDFIAGRDTFSIIIGLLVDNIPTVGVVFVPAKHELFYAQKGQGAFKKIGSTEKRVNVSSVASLSGARMSVRIPTAEVRPLDAAIDKLAVKERIEGGSIGSRTCDIASDKTDLFINTNHRASKWDTLGGEVILNEAGGVILDLKGQKLDYSQPHAKWHELFVVASSQDLAKQTIAQL